MIGDYILIAFDERYNVSFIGKEKRYKELCKQVRDHNNNNEIKCRLLFNDEIIYVDQEYEDLYKVIYDVLVHRFRLFPIVAEIKAELFKNRTIQDYL